MPRGKKATPKAKTEPTMDTAETRPAQDWRDPDAKFDEDDQSPHAKMWRLLQHQKKALGN